MAYRFIYLLRRLATMSPLEQLDIKVLPLNTPLLLMTTEGVLLKDGPVFPLMELQQAQGGVVEIRRAGGPNVLTTTRFSDEYASATFAPFTTPNGLVVFKHRHSRNGCLTTSPPGPHQGINSCIDYEGKWQEWQLLKPVLPASFSET